MQGHQLGSCCSSKAIGHRGLNSKRVTRKRSTDLAKLTKVVEAGASNARNVSREREMRVKIKTKIPNNRSRNNSTATKKNRRECKRKATRRTKPYEFSL